MTSILNINRNSGLWKHGKLWRIFSAQNIVFFIVLFFLYAFRTLDDLTTPYLWAEDGVVLIQRAIDNGFGAFFIPGNGFYWILQQLTASVCYVILLPFGNLSLLPQMMSVIAKASATLCVLYFTSDRFEWVLKGKYTRFFVCVFIMLLLPSNLFDVATCDTSMPFAMFFAAFLIGLNLLLGKEAAMPNVKQTVFLALLCLSHAAAVFIAAFCGLAALRWLVCRVREKNFDAKDFIGQAAKLLVIFSAALIQTLTILSANRSGGELDLFNRFVAVARTFVILPYSQAIIDNSLVRLAAAMVIWVAILYLSRVPKKIAIYCGVFCYLTLFFASLTSSVENWQSNAGGSPRYLLLNYEIVTLLICIVIIQLFRRGKFRRYISVLLIAVVFLASVQTYTYRIAVFGNEFSYYYKNYIGYFTAKGTEHMMIPVGPWRPWQIKVPVSMSQRTVEKNLSVEVVASNENYGISLRIKTHEENGQLPARLLILSEGIYYPSVSTADDIFQVDIYPFDLTDNHTVEIVWETIDGGLYRTSYSFNQDNLKQLGVQQ